MSAYDNSVYNRLRGVVELRHVREVVFGDGLERRARPLAEPVDGTAAHQGGELAETRAEYLRVDEHVKGAFTPEI